MSRQNKHTQKNVKQQETAEYCLVFYCLCAIAVQMAH